MVGIRASRGPRRMAAPAKRLRPRRGYSRPPPTAAAGKPFATKAATVDAPCHHHHHHDHHHYSVGVSAGSRDRQGRGSSARPATKRPTNQHCRRRGRRRSQNLRVPRSQERVFVLVLIDIVLLSSLFDDGRRREPLWWRTSTRRWPTAVAVLVVLVVERLFVERS